MVSEIQPPEVPQPTTRSGKGRTLHTRGETVKGAEGGVVDAVGEVAAVGHASGPATPKVRLRKGEDVPLSEMVSRNANRLSRVRVERERTDGGTAPSKTSVKPDAHVLSLLGLDWG